MSRRRRSAAAESTTDTGRWLVSYADFITVMMIFFIVLWTTARVDDEKFKQLGMSMSIAFFPSGNLMPEPGLPGAGGLGSGESEALPSGEGDALGVEHPAEPADLLFASGDVPAVPGLHPWTGLPVSPEEAGRTVAEELPELIDSGDLQVVQTTRGIVISVQNRVLFDSGSAVVRQEAEAVLTEVARALRGFDNSVLVEGYTDNVPIQTAAFPSNWELSAARATNVLQQLLAQGNLEPDRFAAVGYGEYHNIYPNDTEENRQKNRRVDIVILHERQSLNIGQELEPAR